MSDPDSEKRTCPCKLVPLYLSSFTAAEHGNVSALQRHYTTPQQQSATRQDAAGNTPLHLAAQHGHTAVVALLLQTQDVNGGSSGATALHRASYSGAVACISLLLTVPACNVMCADTSFGDCMTPLHKAASGGRYLAVQLLLEALDDRGLLQQALPAKDSAGKTPLDVAKERHADQTEGHKTVARWDVIAGGVADWDKCVQLLVKASRSEKQTAVGSSNNSRSGNTLSRQSLPVHLMQGSTDCMDCDDESGRCLTSSWETAFRTALLYSVGDAVGAGSKRKDYEEEGDAAQAVDHTMDATHTKVTPAAAGGATTVEASQTEADMSLGQNCAVCTTKTVVLYNSSSNSGQLVCKRCRRLKR